MIVNYKLVGWRLVHLQLVHVPLKLLQLLDRLSIGLLLLVKPLQKVLN